MQRQRTKPTDAAHSLYIYFIGLYNRNTAKASHRFVLGSHVSILEVDAEIQNTTKSIKQDKKRLKSLLLMKP